MKITSEEKKICLNIIEAYISLSDRLALIKKQLIELKENLSIEKEEEYLLLKAEACTVITRMQELIEADKNMEDILAKKYPNMDANTLRLNLFDELKY